MNVTSSTSGSALDALLSALARQRASSSKTSSSETASTTSSSSTAACGTGGPSSPSSFHVSMSTSQFAGVRGPQGGGNPLAQLDSDVQELFKAIDTDSDGTLSSEELSSFDSEMRAKMQGAGHAGRGQRLDGLPPGLPPARVAQESSSALSLSA